MMVSAVIKQVTRLLPEVTAFPGGQLQQVAGIDLGVEIQPIVGQREETRSIQQSAPAGWIPV